jgi:cytochrome c biogenesis protein
MAQLTQTPRQGLQSEAEVLDFAGRSVGAIDSHSDISRPSSPHRVLVGLAFGTGFKYSGQRVIVEGTTFTNQLASYDSFTSGAFVDDASLVPYGLRLTSFEPTYEFDTASGVAQPLDFVATVDVLQGGDSEQRRIRVNEPLDYEGTSVYLLGNGFAPHITITNPDGDVVYNQPVVFLPQDGNLTSLGVIKVPDGLTEQVGMVGFFYPSAVVLESGALSSVFPEPEQPVMTMNVFTGDLGLDEGIPRNVYALETEDMTAIAGGDSDTDALVVGLGQTVELPNNMGSMTFESLPRFISVDVHRDPTQLPVLISSVFIVAGLVTSLFVVRRRAWAKFADSGDGAVVLEVAGLSRGDDPALGKDLQQLAEEISQLGEFKLSL